MITSVTGGSTMATVVTKATAISKAQHEWERKWINQKIMKTLPSKRVIMCPRVWG